MLEDLDSAKQIASLTEGLLQRADAADRWPTPVDDLLAVRELREPEDNPLSPAVLARAPKHLRAAISAIGSGRVRALLDRREREVFVDPLVDNVGRRSFLRLHETCHDLFPWQQELAYADNDATLSPRTQRLFEREANQGAAELLFQRERFAEMAREYRVDFGAVTELAARVGASRRATLRRYAETHHRAVCGLVLDASPMSLSPLRYRRFEVSMSQSWQQRFGTAWPSVLSADAFAFLDVTRPASAFADDDSLFSWPDVDNQPIGIRAQASGGGNVRLLLLWVPAREFLKRRRVEGRRAA